MKSNQKSKKKKKSPKPWKRATPRGLWGSNQSAWGKKEEQAENPKKEQKKKFPDPSNLKLQKKRENAIKMGKSNGVGGVQSPETRPVAENNTKVNQKQGGQIPSQVEQHMAWT